MTPYHQLAAELARLVREGKDIALGGFTPPPRSAAAPGAPRALIFSPHPDDECIVGGLALRLQREAGMHIVNVAVTQGSNKARQAGRWSELGAACGYLGFDVVETAPGGLEQISSTTRDADRGRWRENVAAIRRILTVHQPRVVFCPHATDWNSTHIGTHHLVMDALREQPAGFACEVVETEFWGAMPAPNLMVELTAQQVGDMMAALSFHVGEVQRNPFHVLLPAWMQDNVRRGAELVGGQGGPAPDFSFATLYRVSRWTGGRLEAAYPGGRTLPASMRAEAALAPA